jgi:hypothetical protein
MGNAFLLVVVGLLLYYVVISDKFYCIEGCIGCLAGRDPGPGASGGAGVVPVGVGGSGLGGPAAGSELLQLYGR